MSAFDHYLLFIACKVVIDAIKCCVSDLWRYFLSEEIEKDIKHNQDQSSKMLLLELNFRHNAVVLRVTLKSIMLKFSSIMYLTLLLRNCGLLIYRRGEDTAGLMFCYQTEIYRPNNRGGGFFDRDFTVFNWANHLPARLVLNNFLSAAGKARQWTY